MTSKKKKKNIHIQTEEDVENISPDAAETPGVSETGEAEEPAGAFEVESVDGATMMGQVEKYKKMAEENLKLYQYSRAELENLKKRAIADRHEMRKYGIIPFAKDILHVVDNLERALEHLETADKDSLTKGIQMTLDEFNKALASHGINQVPAIGKFFDPNIHEGFIMVETNSYSPNTVIDEFEKGYMLGDRLVRPAKVSVSVKKKGEEPAAETAEESEEEAFEEADEVVETEIIEE